MDHAITICVAVSQTIQGTAGDAAGEKSYISWNRSNLRRISYEFGFAAIDA